MRETKQLTTPTGKVLVLNAYLKGREKRALKGVYTSVMEAVFDQTGAVRYQIPPNADVTSKAEDKLMELAIVSYDGSADAMLDRIMDAQETELAFVVEECNKLIPKTPEEDPKS